MDMVLIVTKYLKMKKHEDVLNEMRMATQLLDKLTKSAIYQKEVLDIKELAEYTGYKKSYLYKLVSKNKIPHHKPNGGRLFFTRDEIDAWLTSNRITPENEIDIEASNAVKRLHGYGKKQEGRQ